MAQDGEYQALSVDDITNPAYHQKRAGYPPATESWLLGQENKKSPGDLVYSQENLVRGLNVTVGQFYTLRRDLIRLLDVDVPPFEGKLYELDFDTDKDTKWIRYEIYRNIQEHPIWMNYRNATRKPPYYWLFFMVMEFVSTTAKWMHKHKDELQQGSIPFDGRWIWGPERVQTPSPLAFTVQQQTRTPLPYQNISEKTRKILHHLGPLALGLRGRIDDETYYIRIGPAHLRGYIEERSVEMYDVQQLFQKWGEAAIPERLMLPKTSRILICALRALAKNKLLQTAMEQLQVFASQLSATTCMVLDTARCPACSIDIAKYHPQHGDDKYINDHAAHKHPDRECLLYCPSCNILLYTWEDAYTHYYHLTDPVDPSFQYITTTQSAKNLTEFNVVFISTINDGTKMGHIIKVSSNGDIAGSGTSELLKVIFGISKQLHFSKILKGTATGELWKKYGYRHTNIEAEVAKKFITDFAMPAFSTLLEVIADAQAGVTPGSLVICHSCAMAIPRQHRPHQRHLRRGHGIPKSPCVDARHSETVWECRACMVLFTDTASATEHMLLH